MPQRTFPVQPKLAAPKARFVLDIGCNDGTLLGSYNVSGSTGLALILLKIWQSFRGKWRIKFSLDFLMPTVFWQTLNCRNFASKWSPIAMFYDLEDPNRLVSIPADHAS
jgi:hypothetical protein